MSDCIWTEVFTKGSNATETPKRPAASIFKLSVFCIFFKTIMFPACVVPSVQLCWRLHGFAPWILFAVSGKEVAACRKSIISGHRAFLNELYSIRMPNPPS